MNCTYKMGHHRIIFVKNKEFAFLLLFSALFYVSVFINNKGVQISI